MTITATIDFDTAYYDRDADVLYLSVGDPARAVDFDETPDGHALRYDASGHLIGITIVGVRTLVDEHRKVHIQAPVNAASRRPCAGHHLTARLLETLVDEHRDIHVQAPVTLPADALAQIIG